MSLNNTPSSERVHIGIFGKRNAGKSSLINAVTSQNLAIVSDIKGTTTDPVMKAMELLPLGPVVLIDTPGLDDSGELGLMRIQKAHQALNRCDIAVLVIDALEGITPEDGKILEKIQKKQIPCILAINKCDLLSSFDSPVPLTDSLPDSIHTIRISARNGQGIFELKEMLAASLPVEDKGRRIVGDLIHPSSLVILVIPIDKAAPKGRLILPQQQTIRDILDSGAYALTVRETELAAALSSIGRTPDLVITDSQVFPYVAEIVPEEIPLTSFSILFARYKGNLKTLADGARALDSLKEDDTILISEGCTHHRQCEDIGTVKLPNLIRKHTGCKDLTFSFTSGTEFPADLSGFSMIVHCGGCTLNEREMKYRLSCAEDAGIPITNYGTAIAHMNGILPRCLQPFSL
ncbi:[FeFe] hydrogenase H-cluster maturation GTPase HydF [Claveliimonas bilis]|uniref:[FeFe] hydrogenase H-cluster maturation GTPase HydF n=1 Tax=Claveliimonas bilis TaxID=3028070 RepID=A0ABM8I185_9FIRM|nr:[FeFe] hydrogenase H-cluster maturation GTPase HydF [Claveliimonas bilis]BDZ76628.1 [FeFe] hydrogenase H-cluster maturation GTPase HydF [Claveliimonas bilis]